MLCTHSSTLNFDHIHCIAGTSKKIDMSKYQTLSEEQKAKILAALEKQRAAEQPAASATELPTESIEEFISISDGQVCNSN